MKIAANKLMEKATGASIGITVAIAFLNVALLVTKVIQAVAEEASEAEENETAQ